MDFFIENKKTFLIISIIINCLLLSICCYLVWNIYNHECLCVNDNVQINQDNLSSSTEEQLYVDVKGAVKNPGVYEVKRNNIINDVINLAGGFTKSAYTKNINLSKKISDELVIYVYSNSEYKKLNEPKTDQLENEIITYECICPDYDISDCVNSGNSEIVTDSKEKEEVKVEEDIKENNNLSNENTSKLININTATIDELMTLNGIGEAKAKSIIEYRNKNKFTKIEDIKNVSGIGDSAFEKIKEFITIK